MINKNLIELKKILLAGSDEGWNVKELDIDAFKKYINTDFSDSWNQYLKGNSIYRGERNIIDNISYVIPGNRYSQNTFNCYNELFSEILPSWKDFPKRNHSVICSTSNDRSGVYGNVFVILPKNGTSIGVCSKHDIWISFPLFDKKIKDIVKLNDFAETIMIIMYALYNKKVDLKFLLEDFKNHEKIDIINFSEKYTVINFYELLYKNRNNLFNFLNNIFDPYKNGFKLLTINDTLPENREVWFDNHYIAIKYDIIDDVIENMEYGEYE
jgi:hypothetical protein